MSKKTELAASNRDAYFRSTKAPGPIAGLKVGETVAYTDYFCRQIGSGPTDPMNRARGKVISLHENGVWAEVRWAGEDAPRHVALQHLARPGANTRYCT